MRADRLVAFIFVRENENVRGKKCSFKKGTEAMAESGSEGTLIRRAWELRSSVPVMRVPLRERNAAPQPRKPVSISQPLLGYAAAQGQKASEILCNVAPRP